ncbi:MAG TPA: YCF48-related protein [Acidobacteriaceae bacterium]|jgi:photosystem II stability/assembly factor-like uncharacterized protein
MLRLLSITVVVFALACRSAGAQWTLQDSRTTADLRGVDFVGNGVAWASGTHGTVLRTEDMGFVWQVCAVPPGADKLDFRGVQAFDANTAIVMSIGSGDQSRLYKTTDGCQTWKLLFTNPDKDGFWDAIRASDPDHIMILGDPVAGHLTFRSSSDGGKTWKAEATPPSETGEGAFAASNTSLLQEKAGSTCRVPVYFGTGGPNGARLFSAVYDKAPSCHRSFSAQALPAFPKSASAGIFGLGAGPERSMVAVGGDYQKPEERTGAAAYRHGSQGWLPAAQMPGGFRSAAEYYPKHKVWITVGPNGTDVSTDDGRDWRPLKPAAGDAQDADKRWNALSLPFVVGPKGRIGILREDALQHPSHD